MGGAGVAGALVVLNIFCAAQAACFPVGFLIYEWPFGNGAHSALVMAGVVTAQIFFGLRPGTGGRPAGEGLRRYGHRVCPGGAGCRMAGRAAGNLQDPRHSGVDAVEYWRGGAGVYAALLDMRPVAEDRWAALVRPAGANTLLTYLLPDRGTFCWAR